MNEQHVYPLRRRAIRLALQGHSRQAILARIPRSPAWLSKWLRRFDELGWQGLQSPSRARLHHSARYSDHTRHLVGATRQRLLKRCVGLSGPQAIQDELHQAQLLKHVPSLATIKRILHHAGRRHTALGLGLSSHISSLTPSGTAPPELLSARLSSS